MLLSLFVSDGISLCTIIIADDKMLVPLEATVPVITVHCYRLQGGLCRVTTLKHYGTVCVECVLLAIKCEKCTM
jgi:hypothetical protein